MFIQIQIPNNFAQGKIDIFANIYGYEPTIKDAEGLDIPNPQTKVAFIKERMTQEFLGTIKKKYADYIMNEALAQKELIDQQARIQAETDTAEITPA